MVRLAPPAERGECPSRQALHDFNCGRLAEPALEALASHAANCGPCLAALSAIQQYAAKEGIDVRLRRVLEGPSENAGTDADANDRCAHDASEQEPLVGTTLGRYTLLEKIGTGGMGVVFRAEQRPVKQFVALKTIRDLFGAGPDRLARFRTEGEALARLQHPNVVRLYHFDDHTGRPYFTMELVEGGSLAEKLRNGPLDFTAAAELVRTVSAAVAYAHGRQVVHRDLKPHNVLLTADGTPKVSDFGLAKLLDGSFAKMATGHLMGTPSYMSPEQAGALPGAVGPPTDVHALGAILYACLTGHPPFEGADQLEILEKVRTADPAPPSARRPGVPADLEAVCLKCLEKNPNWRYESAASLAADLARWLEGKATKARPLTRAGRAGRWAWRNARRVGSVAAALALAAATVGAVLTSRPPPSTLPDGESDRVRQQLEADLDQGRPVALVSETGWPKWFRWQAGKEVQRTHIEPGGTFSAEMLDRHATGLLELLPDARTDRYKLTAQVRHDQGGYGGFVGLYVAHRVYPRHPRDIQFFAQVQFNAVTATPRVLVLPQPKERVPENHTQQMLLALRLHTDRIDSPNVNEVWNEAFGPRLLARGPRNGVWHDLEVTVGPDGVTAAVDGNRMEMAGTTLTSKSLHAGIEGVRARHAEDPAVQNLCLEFAPRGGLGLVLYPLSAASVRRVTVTPLPGGQ